MPESAPQTWTPEGYSRNARFVSDFGGSVVELLSPQPGERILDLGCGDGALSLKMVEAGAAVVGVDSSEELAAAARVLGIDVRVVDAQHLSFNQEFDAVFSNAALHWMQDIDGVLDGVRRALRPGGRFVGELGGHGNVAAIMVALRAVLAKHGYPLSPAPPLFFPTAEEFSGKLTAHGFRVLDMILFPRPTPLPTGMEGWLETFAVHLLGRLPATARAEAAKEAVELLRPSLCDQSGRWTADYVRLRFAAV